MSLGLLTSTLRVVNSLKRTTTEGYDKVSGLVTSQLVLGDNTKAFSHLRKKKSRLEMILLSCAVCGIEFCYAAETAFVTPTLRQIGVPMLYMSLIWGVSPLLGVLLVPVLGSLSDGCGLQLGRRRPFILLLSAGIVAGLLLVPNGKLIGTALGDQYQPENTQRNPDSDPEQNNIGYTESSWANSTYESTSVSSTQQIYTEQEPTGGASHHPWSIVFTMLGVVLLDFSCDACQSPCRAYLLDVSVPEDHSTGLSTFTIMAGAGGALGYVLGGVNWEETRVGARLGGHVRVVFTLVLFIYMVCVSITVSSFKEVPLHMLGITAPDVQSKKKSVSGQKYRKFTNEPSTSDEEQADESKTDTGLRQKLNGNKHYVNGSKQQLAESKQGYGTLGQIQGLAGHSELKQDPKAKTKTTELISETENIKSETDNKTDVDQFQKVTVTDINTEITLKTYLKSIIHLPKSLVILCVTNLFCWMSLVCYSLYFTDFVGQAVYGGNPNDGQGTAAHTLYDRGVRIGSFGMSLYSISCSFYSLNIERLVQRFGARRVYMASQLVYTVGALLMAWSRHPLAVILLSPTAGVMYATLFTMPYLLVAHYHTQNAFAATEEGAPARQQVRGLGTDIAVVSSMVFLAQFLLSAFMGTLMHLTDSTAIVMYTAALLSLCGAIAASQVLYMGL